MGRSARAWVCLNGHTKTSGFGTTQTRDYEGDHCTKCGALLVGWCLRPGCGRDIGPFVKMAEPPSYCPGCGETYPWFESKLAATVELLAETDLTEQERNEVVTDVRDVVRDAPRRDAAVARFRRLMGKAKIGDAIRSIFVDVLSEAAKRSMFGP